MTTNEEHNKYLAYSHLGYAAFQLLMMLMMLLFFFIMFAGVAANDTSGEFPAGFVAAILIFVGLFQLILTAPSAIAGYGLAAMSFPLGTAVCVYTFWFLFGASGKDFYSGQLTEGRARSDYYLNEQREDDSSIGSWKTERKREYVPPKEMPNWRE
jgi:hypothetical protein